MVRCYCQVHFERRAMMKPLAAVATLSAILSLFAADRLAAQPQQLAPIATAPAAAEPAAAPEAKKMAANTKGRRWLKADARVCLEFPNDMQVIKCSENYR
jgi:hypothetical protein